MHYVCLLSETFINCRLLLKKVQVKNFSSCFLLSMYTAECQNFDAEVI